MFQDAASSLPLQISLYFHGYYSIALVVLSLLIFIYKSALLPYPPSILGFEVTYVFLYGIVEWVRIRQGPLVCGVPLVAVTAGLAPWPTQLLSPRGSPAAIFLPPPTHTLPPSILRPGSLKGQQAGEHLQRPILHPPRSASACLPHLLHRFSNVRAEVGHYYPGAGFGGNFSGVRALSVGSPCVLENTNPLREGA